MPKPDLVEYLRERIAEQNRVDAAAFGPSLRETIAPAPSADAVRDWRASALERMQVIDPECNKRQLAKKRAIVVESGALKLDCV